MTTSGGRTSVGSGCTPEPKSSPCGLTGGGREGVSEEPGHARNQSQGSLTPSRHARTHHVPIAEWLLRGRESALARTTVNAIPNLMETRRANQHQTEETEWHST